MWSVLVLLGIEVVAFGSDGCELELELELGVSLRSPKRSLFELCFRGPFVSSCGVRDTVCVRGVLLKALALALASSCARANSSSTAASSGILSDSRTDSASSWIFLSSCRGLDT